MKNWKKYSLSFILVFLFRLLPFRVPNVEPIMAVISPLGKIYGGVMSFVFGFLSIFSYDLVTSGIGVWTLVTAMCYGLIGFSASIYLKNRTGWKNYATYAAVATLVYDALTGLTIGPLFFHQSFIVSLVGQIPFTVIHLLGNVSFAIILSPAIEKWFVTEKKFLFVSKLSEVKI